MRGLSPEDQALRAQIEGMSHELYEVKRQADSPRVSDQTRAQALRDASHLEHALIDALQMALKHDEESTSSPLLESRFKAANENEIDEEITNTLAGNDADGDSEDDLIVKSIMSPILDLLDGKEGALGGGKSMEWDIEDPKTGVASLEIPVRGMDPESVEVQIVEGTGMMTVTASGPSESFEEELPLPYPVPPLNGSIDAAVEDGVLRIVLPPPPSTHFKGIDMGGGEVEAEAEAEAEEAEAEEAEDDMADEGEKTSLPFLKTDKNMCGVSCTSDSDCSGKCPDCLLFPRSGNTICQLKRAISESVETETHIAPPATAGATDPKGIKAIASEVISAGAPIPTE